MKWCFRIALFGLASAIGQAAMAQDFNEPLPRKATAPSPSISPGEVNPTEAMWFYQEQQRLYNDPHYMQRKRAEFKGEQRARRIAAMKWFGYSNARPSAGITPWSGGMYSPAWVGNSRDSYAWRGAGSAPQVVVRQVRVIETQQGLW